MVARQLKVVSQIDAFTISASRNIQYFFKKLVCFMVFVKDIFDIYLNNIYHIVFPYIGVALRVNIIVNCCCCIFQGKRTYVHQPSVMEKLFGTVLVSQEIHVHITVDLVVRNHLFPGSLVELMAPGIMKQIFYVKTVSWCIGIMSKYSLSFENINL